VRVHEAGPRFRGERGVRTWVLRITANLCRDRLRRRRFTAGSLDGPTPIEDPGLRFDPGGEWGERLDRGTMAGGRAAVVGAVGGGAGRGDREIAGGSTRGDRDAPPAGVVSRGDVRSAGGPAGHCEVTTRPGAGEPAARAAGLERMRSER